MDAYIVLGITRTASAQEIKRAYREKVKLHHPDRNNGCPIAAQRFNQVQEAYDFLCGRRPQQQRRPSPSAANSRPVTVEVSAKVIGPYNWLISLYDAMEVYCRKYNLQGKLRVDVTRQGFLPQGKLQVDIRGPRDKVEHLRRWINDEVAYAKKVYG